MIVKHTIHTSNILTILFCIGYYYNTKVNCYKFKSGDLGYQLYNFYSTGYLVNFTFNLKLFHYPAYHFPGCT